MNMTKLFLSVVEVTLGTSLVVLVLLLLSPLTAKFLKRKFRYWAWLILALRLVIPVSVTPTPVINVEIPEREIVVVTNREEITPPIQNENVVIPPEENDGIIPITPTQPQKPSRPSVYVRPSESAHITDENAKTMPLTTVMSIVWAVGVLGVILVQIASYLNFSRRTRRFDVAVEDEQLLNLVFEISKELGIKKQVRVYRNAKVHSPLLIGFFSPAVLIPKKVEGYDDILMILRHELMHLKRADTWYKLLLSITCAIHWFNPIVWLMRKVADDDLENACDEDVVKNRDEVFRHSYCESILRAIRSQKSREPLFTAGFSSRPGDIRARFLRILDMTKKRAGKTALAVLLCLSLLCTAFIGCDLAGDIIDTVSGENSGTQLKFAQLEEILKKELEQTISNDPAMMSELMNNVRYEQIETIDEVTSRYDTEGYSDILKASFFKVKNEYGLDHVILMTHRTGFYYENEVITSKLTDQVSLYKLDVDNISTDNFENAEITVSENHLAQCVYLPSNGSALMYAGDSENKFEEIKNQDKENPYMIEYKIWLSNNLYEYFSVSEGFVQLINKKGEKFIGVYDSVEKEIKVFGDTPLPKDENVSSWAVLNEGDGKIYIPREDGIALYNLESETPYTPYAVISGENLGYEKITPLRNMSTDRNNSDRICTGFKTEDSTLGFVTLNLNGEVLNSFLINDIKITQKDYFSGLDFVDNVAYFSHEKNEYLKRVRTSYAVDTRKDHDNTPSVKETSEYNSVNVKAEEFDYSLSAPFYPFKLGDKIALVGQREIIDKDGHGFWFTSVEYNGETKDLKAVANSSSGFARFARLKGKVYEDKGEVYFEVDNLKKIPLPYDDFTDCESPVKIKIASDDTTALWEYIKGLNLDLNDVTIGFQDLMVERKNNTLSYTIQLLEIYNGSEDYFDRQNHALEIMKVYGLVSNGIYEKRLRDEYEFSEYNFTPSMKTTPFSMLNYNYLDGVEKYLGWYEMYKRFDEVQNTNYSYFGSISDKFKREVTVNAQEFEQAVTKYFDISVNTLRESKNYNATTNTYSADFKNSTFAQANSASSIEYYRIGNTMQIRIYSNATENYQFITVKLENDGGFKFVKTKISPMGYDIVPECFNTALFDINL